ncbi:MAG: class II aldolase/adducin family protein [Gammaproteobacteria bacterium]
MNTATDLEPNEHTQRRDLAAVHRLIARHGWDDFIFTLISCRVPGTENELLATPFPQICNSVTASSLVKTDLEGNVIGEGAIDSGGFPLYGAIHRARPDVGCIIHLHTTAGVAIASQQQGLLPLSQTSMILIEDIAYFDYQGIGQGDDEIPEAMGEKNVLMLRNHGTLAVGRTVAEAFARIYLLETACAIQVAASNQPTVPVTQTIASGVAALGKPYITSGIMEQAWSNLLLMLDKEDPDYVE